MKRSLAINGSLTIVSSVQNSGLIVLIRAISNGLGWR
jgi:hypothetical protein